MSDDNATGGLDFFTLSTSVDISDTTRDQYGSTKLDKIIQLISFKGQPLIRGKVFLKDELYTFRFATEHSGAWDERELEEHIRNHGANHGFKDAATVTVSRAVGL